MSRALFAAAYARRRAMDAAFDVSHKAIEAGFLKAVVEAALIKKPKSKVDDLPRASRILGDAEFHPLRDAWQARASSSISIQTAANEAIEKEMRALAPEAEILPGESYRIFAESWLSSFRSTNSGNTYAKASAESYADTARAHKVEFAIEPHWFDGSPHTGEPHSYRVMVKVAEELDVQILKRRGGATIREWVRTCWARGVNPRVFQPFLPYGYEERNGLDYFGNDLRTRIAP